MQSRDSAAGTLRLCVAALLFLSGWHRPPTRPSRQGSKPPRHPPLSLNEEFDASAAPGGSGPALERRLLDAIATDGRLVWLARQARRKRLQLLRRPHPVLSGGDHRRQAQRFAYGGRGDYLIDFDTGKLGLWEGGHLDLRGETRLGQDCNEIDGAVAPSNFAMALPLPNQNVTALTGVQYTQDLSESVSVFFGKLNLLDGTPAAYARGMRLNYFWNAAMQSNLSRAYLIPSTLGAGFTVRDEVEPVFNFYLLDTHYTPTTSGFSTLFSNGVVAYGEYRQRTNWFDLPGHSAVGFLYSNATRTALDFNPYLVLPAVLAGEPLPTKNSAWTADLSIRSGAVRRCGRSETQLDPQQRPRPDRREPESDPLVRQCVSCWGTARSAAAKTTRSASAITISESANCRF